MNAIPSLEEVKKHLRLEEDFIDDDLYIDGLIGAAVDLAEKFCDASIGNLNYAGVKTANLIKVGDLYDIERNSYTNIRNNETWERLLMHYRKITTF